MRPTAKTKLDQVFCPNRTSRGIPSSILDRRRRSCPPQRVCTRDRYRPPALQKSTEVAGGRALGMAYTMLLEKMAPSYVMPTEDGQIISSVCTPMHTHATAATTRAHCSRVAPRSGGRARVSVSTLDALQLFHGGHDPREPASCAPLCEPGARCTLRAASQLPPVCSLRPHTVTRM